MTAAIEFVEVGPRDGLQNEQHIVSTAEKISLIERAVAAGVRRIEVASFVHPARVPQMADAEAVIAGLALPADVTTIGLVLNKKGALRALATKVDELGAVCVASDGFGQKNQGQSSAESVVTATEIVRLAKAQGRSAQVTISTAFGCPFDGRVAPEQVVAIARELAAAGPREIALTDTIGVLENGRLALHGKVDDLLATAREVTFTTAAPRPASLPEEWWNVVTGPLGSTFTATGVTDDNALAAAVKRYWPDAASLTIRPTGLRRLYIDFLRQSGGEPATPAAA